MDGSYELVVLHRGLEAVAEEVQREVQAATKEIFLQPNLVRFSGAVTPGAPREHVAVVYLGTSAAALDDAVDDQLRQAINNDIPILPLVRATDPGPIHQKLPDRIKHINAIDWDESRGPSTNAILSSLSLTEADRRVFLSYSRQDTTPFAVQLHTALAQVRFDVFLDRFAVPPGTDFQERLDQDLGDKAFVVLIESPSLRSSRWVQHEISYAHSHRIGILALTMPDTQPDQLVPSIDEAFRERLAGDDLEGDGRVREAALRRLLERIELRHARELRRRREQLIGSVRDKLLMDGCTSEPIGEWALLASAPKHRSSVFLVTPRRPRPHDLYALHLVHQRAAGISAGGIGAAVVHETEHISEEERLLLEWIGEPRQFESILLRGCVLAPEPTT